MRNNGVSELIISEIGEVTYSTDWYDYESKYSTTNKINIPAEINSEITKKLNKLLFKVVKHLIYMVCKD